MWPSRSGPQSFLSCSTGSHGTGGSSVVHDAGVMTSSGVGVGAIDAVASAMTVGGANTDECGSNIRGEDIVAIAGKDVIGAAGAVTHVEAKDVGAADVVFMVSASAADQCSNDIASEDIRYCHQCYWRGHPWRRCSGHKGCW